MSDMVKGMWWQLRKNEDSLHDSGGENRGAGDDGGRRSVRSGAWKRRCSSKVGETRTKELLLAAGASSRREWTQLRALAW